MPASSKTADSGQGSEEDTACGEYKDYDAAAIGLLSSSGCLTDGFTALRAALRSGRPGG